MGSKFADKTFINTNTTTQVATGIHLLHRVIVQDIGTSWTITIYDDTGTGTNNMIAAIKPTQTGTLEFMVKCQKGIKVVTSGSAAGAILVVWE